MLEQQLEQDIKAAMLAKQADKVTTLRGLKAAILSVKVAQGTRGEDMPDDQVITLLSKEAKKRQESADLYLQGGNQPKADAELAEKAIIEAYLPEQMDEADILACVDDVIAELEAKDIKAMGQVIGMVKKKVGAAADGAVVARLVKQRLSQ